MRKNILFPFKDFVERALVGGTMVATTLEHARKIADDAGGPCVIKLLAQYDVKYRSAFLLFAEEAGTRGIWVICDEATFLESVEFGGVK